MLFFLRRKFMQTQDQEVAQSLIKDEGDENIDIKSLLTGEPSRSSNDPKPVVSADELDDLDDGDEDAGVYGHKGFRNPHIKLWGSLGAFTAVLVMVFVGVMGSCNDPSTQKAMSPADQEKARLLQQIAHQNGVIAGYAAKVEKAAQQRQQQEYLKNLQDKGKKSVKPKGEQIAAARRDLQREARSQRLASSVSGFSTPYRAIAATSAPSRTIAATPAPRPVVREKSENDAKMNALAQQQAAIREEIAALRENNVAQTSPQTDSQPEVQNVAMEPDVQPVDGGYQEAALMSGNTPVMIGAGAEAEAILNTPIAQQSSPVLMTLQDDIKGSDNQVILPAGTRLQGTAQMSGTLVNIAVQSAMVNGQTMQIPPEFANAIAVMKKNNQPLTANKIGGGSQFGKALVGGLISAGAGFAGQLLTPQTTTSISSNGFVEQTSTSRPNTLGNAALSAGNQFGQSVAGEMNQQLTQDTSGASVMAVKAGTKIKMMFTTDVPLVTASNAIPDPALSSEVPMENTAEPVNLPQEVPSPQEEINEPLMPEESGQLIEQQTDPYPDMG
jgi:hypothetical protein